MFCGFVRQTFVLTVRYAWSSYRCVPLHILAAPVRYRASRSRVLKIECGFESYRFECQQCNAALACVIDTCDESLLVSQPNI